MQYSDKSNLSLTGVEWLELEITVSPKLVSQVEVALEDSGIKGWVQEAEEPDFILVCYLPCEPGWEANLGCLSDNLHTEGALLRIRRTVADEDWANTWKQFYHPTKLTDRIVVCPSWETYKPAENELVMTLDPGMAFGTGLHASTALCLNLIENFIETHPGCSVLDVGTGSGIQAAAALLLGSGSVLAVDNDPIAVKVAKENLAINNYVNQAKVYEFSGVPGGEFDLVVANLIASLLKQLAKDLAGSVAKNGRLVIGGIIEERKDEVIKAFEDNLMVVEEAMLKDTWVALRLKHAN